MRASLRVLLAFSIVAAVAPRAHAADDFTFAGRGWGHAVGLSQYGARAMAAEGSAARTILRRYYRGVVFQKIDSGSIRVLVESSRDVVVTSYAKFSGYHGSTRVAGSTSSRPYLRALATEDGTAVQRAAGHAGPWSTVVTVGGPVAFKPTDQPLQLVFGDGSVRFYRGALVARRTSETKIHAVNSLPVEAYLRGVVPREVPPSWAIEAVKAQTIAARSYALNHRGRSRASGRWYDICASTSCQVYGGAARKASPSGEKIMLEDARANSAIGATAGIVMVHNDESAPGKIVLAVFSSSSGGKTENSGDAWGSSTVVPYLRSVDDPWSISSASGNPYRSWRKTVDGAAIASAVGLDRVDRIRVADRNVSGSARTVAFDGVRDGAAETVTRTGRWVRSAFGLRSTFIASVS